MQLFRRILSYQELRAEIEESRSWLLKHPIYGIVDNLESLRIFMEAHVFAVWDFMSLSKRLQNELTCTSLPWMPPANPRLARFANEVILAEESDVGLDGVPGSHLELYLEAMREVGASTTMFDNFMERLLEGDDVARALAVANVPQHIRRFVLENIETAIAKPTPAVAASFLFGREDLIPDMFTRLLEQCGNTRFTAPTFSYYLRRHIELDGDEHGPLGQIAMTTIAAGNARNWRIAAKAAKRAIKHRILLWDGVCESIRAARGSRSDWMESAAVQQRERNVAV